MKDNSNRKLLIVAIFTIVCLLGSIGFVAYSTFSASITGTKINAIGGSTGSGYIVMSGAMSAKTDSDKAVGYESSNTFTLTGKAVGKMYITYTASFTNVSTGCSPQVKVASTGTIASVINDFNSYKALSASQFGAGEFVFAGTGTDSSEESIAHTYTVTMKCTATGSNSTSSNTTAHCSDSTKTTKSACETAGAVWGTSQSVTSGSLSGSYKVTISATQEERPDLA